MFEQYLDALSFGLCPIPGEETFRESLLGLSSY